MSKRNQGTNINQNHRGKSREQEVMRCKPCGARAERPKLGMTRARVYETYRGHERGQGEEEREREHAFTESIREKGERRGMPAQTRVSV